jgi:hypothetical protein
LRRASGGRLRKGKEKSLGNGIGVEISDSGSVGSSGGAGGLASGACPIVISTLVWSFRIGDVSKRRRSYKEKCLGRISREDVSGDPHSTYGVVEALSRSKRVHCHRHSEHATFSSSQVVKILPCCLKSRGQLARLPVSPPPVRHC